MGGDHKCPVCQATFTRPQHVARHMRSHTGDRPYKCQYCGDQFARSDLLSRHVNKCHSSEKPLPTAGTSRRKGSASASRATTSKQACDQCVQSSLPCDGCNPCAKCVQRKCRCTFVKFHRQTAPVGPGHNPRPSSSSSRIPIYSQSDQFVLGPAPSPSSSAAAAAPVPTMADNLYSQSFSFPPLYSTPADPTSSTLSLDEHAANFSERYRTQADLLRRNGAMDNSGAGLASSLFTDPRSSAPSSSSTSAAWMNWPHDAQSQFPGAQDAMQDRELQAELTRSYLDHGLTVPTTAPLGGGSSAGAYPPTSYIPAAHAHARRGSADFGSDGSTASHSVPSSATSSAVHLPLENIPQGQTVSYTTMPEGPSYTHSRPSSSHHHHQQHHQQQQQQQQQHSHRGSISAVAGEGGFSSAFGLMSLDDPNVLAGLSSDGTPFFSHVAMGMMQDEDDDPNTTPMPGRGGQGQDRGQGRDQGHQVSPQQQNQQRISRLPTPGSSRDTETRELREFWKQYMRTPLSGPGPSALDTIAPGGPGANNHHYNNNNHHNNSGSPTHRRPRVASLPSVKTPTGEVDRWGNAVHHPAPHPAGNQQQYPQQQQQQQEQQQPGATSSMRTTLHGNEDLRSYEAAVLARKAPTTLSLGPRSRRGTTGGAALPAPATGAGGRGSASVGGSPIVGGLAGLGLNAGGVYGQAKGQGGLQVPTASSSGSRPGSAAGPRTPSSSASSSSLAGAFGKHGVHVTFPSGAQGQSVSPPSRESSLSVDDGASAGSSDREASLRPSFKRLPSQTLGPAYAKRALLASGRGGGVDEVSDEGGGGGEYGRDRSREGGVAGIAERRRRRMSAPTTSPTYATFSEAGQV